MSRVRNRLAGPGAVPLLTALLLNACAMGPRFDTAGVDAGLTPANSATELPGAAGKRVLWGGVILHTTNLKARTDIEVLGYPLDDNQEPQRDERALGRFIVQVRGYLEPATYAKDRVLTIVGRLETSQTGKVGDSPYVYPVVSSEQLYLWPQESEYDRSNVHFGIGIGIGF